MAISDKTRKLIWGRSGNQCGVCQRELLMEATSTDDAAVVGDECHIVGPKAGSPRHDPAYPSEKLDHCENLILLCRVHHKMVDDQPVAFSADVLRAVKASHERRVKDALQTATQSATHILLPRIRTGRDLLHSVLGVFAYDFDHDEPKSAADAEIIGGFLQTAKDWGEVGDDLDAGQRVRVGHDLSATIRAVESAGYVVLGRKVVDTVPFSSGDAEVWPVAVIRVLHAGNPILQQQSSDI
jgi:hypothetical protein